MEYIFIFDENSNGWWLKIDSVEKLADYHEKTGSGRYDGAMEMYLREGHPSDILSKLNMKERIEKMQDKNFKRLQAAVIWIQMLKHRSWHGANEDIRAVWCNLY